jgi:Uncharacterized protein conserved in bacteria
MTITKLEETAKGKINVYIDGAYEFFLYSREIRLFHLEENREITSAALEEIINSVILKRAKQKAMDLLKTTDRTESELWNKLRQSGYSEAIIEKAVEYVKNFHYIDDARYALNYVRNKKDRKSRRQLEGELIQKGIEKQLIEAAFLQEYENEEKAVRNAILKKNVDIANLTREGKLKLISSLYRKGFKLDIIKKYLNDDNLDNYE